MEETQQNSLVEARSEHAAVVMNPSSHKSKHDSLSPNHGHIAPEQLAPKGYLSFVEARKFAVSLNLRTRKEWRSYVKGELPHMPPKPANIPAHPDGIYKVKGWQGWKFWLGTADGSLGSQSLHQ